MDASSASTSNLRPEKRSRARLLELPPGRGGAGRLVERWMWLWRWETWAGDRELARRPRGGWSLTYRAALVSSQDALDDYEIARVGPGSA